MASGSADSASQAGQKAEMPLTAYPPHIVELVETLSAMPRDGLDKFVQALSADETRKYLPAHLLEQLRGCHEGKPSDAQLRTVSIACVKALSASDAERNARLKSQQRKVQVITFALAAVVIGLRLWQQGVLDDFIRAVAQAVGLPLPLSPVSAGGTTDGSGGAGKGKEGSASGGAAGGGGHA